MPKYLSRNLDRFKFEKKSKAVTVEVPEPTENLSNMPTSISSSPHPSPSIVVVEPPRTSQRLRNKMSRHDKGETMQDAKEGGDKKRPDPNNKRVSNYATRVQKPAVGDARVDEVVERGVGIKKVKNCPNDALTQTKSPKRSRNVAKKTSPSSKPLQDFPVPSPLSSQPSKRATSPPGFCPLDDPIFAKGGFASEDRNKPNNVCSDAEDDPEKTVRRKTRRKKYAPFPMSVPDQASSMNASISSSNEYPKRVPEPSSSNLSNRMEKRRESNKQVLHGFALHRPTDVDIYLVLSIPVMSGWTWTLH